MALPSARQREGVPNVINEQRHSLLLGASRRPGDQLRLAHRRAEVVRIGRNAAAAKIEPVSVWAGCIASSKALAIAASTPSPRIDWQVGSPWRTCNSMQS